jgi:resuscitation-promoting factor RpfB
MPLRRMIVVLSLSFLLSQQLLTQTPSQAPSSGSSAPQTSGTPNDNPPKAKCTETGTYVNSQGQTVKRPENCTTAPRGATAQCRDGTYSFSKSRRGTCSHHGGVAKWLSLLNL